MAAKMCDFIIIPRSIFRDESLDDKTFSRREAFLYLVQKAGFKDQTIAVKGGRVDLKRGQLCASIRYLSNAWGWSKDKVSRTLNEFVSEGRIDIFKDTLTSVISIVNYDLYQPASDTCKDTDKDTCKDTNKDTNKDKYNKENNDKKERNKEEYSYADAAKRLYALYPGSTVRADGNRVSLKTAKKDKEKIVRMLSSGEYTEESLGYAIKRYLSEAKPEYLKNFQTFLNQVPDYSESDGGLFAEKKWKVVGEKYNYEDVHALVKGQNEFLSIPPIIRMALMDGKEITWDGEAFSIVEAEGVE